MKSNYKRLGDYIQEVKGRNFELKASKLLGINIDKFFMPSVANIVGTDMSVYKIVKKEQFACNRMHVGRDFRLPVALSKSEEDFMISPAYDVFEVIDTDILMPEYLMMWFSRKEFDRNAWFYTDADVRGGLAWKAFCDMQLPVPAITKQQEIVREYHVLLDRIALNKQLIQKLEETAQAIYKNWFVDRIDLENLPEEWRMGKLSEMAELIIAGIIPEYEIEGHDIVLGQRCVNNQFVELKFARPHLPKINCTLLKFGDILINSTGTGTLGRVGQIYFEPKKLAFDSNMTLVRAKKDSYIDYLGCFLSLKEAHFIQISQGSTNQTRLYCSMIYPLDILIPKEDILIAFKGKVRAVKLLRQKIRTENVSLNNLSNLLLSKLSTQ